MAQFSSLPIELRTRILSLLFHHNPAIIHDRPASGHILLSSTRQTTYQTAELGRTTYLALPTCAARQQIHEHDQFTSYPGLATQVLQVSREWYGIGAGHLYDRVFAFAGSAKSCLAFLHDHRWEAHRIARCVVFFSSAASEYGPATDLEEWRRLFNTLVHERNDLQCLGVVVRKEFWFEADWDVPLDPVETVFWARRVYQGQEDGWRNFLQHVARLRRGVRLEVMIEDSSHSADRQEFADDLGFYVHMQHLRRENYANGRSGSCATRELERSCYWLLHLAKRRQNWC